SRGAQCSTARQRAVTPNGVKAISRGLSASDTPGGCRRLIPTPAGVAASLPTHALTCVGDRARRRTSEFGVPTRRCDATDGGCAELLRPLPGSNNRLAPFRGYRWRSTPG